MKMNKKMNLIIFFIATELLNTIVYSNTGVTCIFKNTTDFPVTFKSFQDTNSRPAETKNLKIGESFKSNITAAQTVTYDIQANIHSLAYPFMLIGAYDIVFNTALHPHEFSLVRSSFTNPDPASQNAILSTVQVTNRTTFPINASIVLKDTGQANAYIDLPYQAVKSTKLPVNGFYAITDTIEKLTVASGLTGYNSGPLPLTSVKSRYDIINHHGSIKIYMTK